MSLTFNAKDAHLLRPKHALDLRQDTCVAGVFPLVDTCSLLTEMLLMFCDVALEGHEGSAAAT